MSAARSALRIGLIAMAMLAPAQAVAQEFKDPFRDKDERAARERARAERQSPATRPGAAIPDGGFVPGEVTRGALPPLNASAAPVERGDLQPVPSRDGPSRDGTGFRDVSGFSDQLWNGLDAAAVEEHLARLEPPLRSPVLLSLWKRMWLSPSGLAGGGDAANRFAALRIETLYRYGLMNGLRDWLRQPGKATGVAAVAMEARARIGVGDREHGCARIRSVVRQISELPKLARADALLISGYCAMAEKNTAAAGVAAELAHDQHAGASTALAVLDAFAAGAGAPADVPGPLSLLDYRFLELAGAADAAKAVKRADGPLLAMLAADANVDPRVRLQAFEAAGQPNSTDAELMAEIYRAQAFEAGQLADAAAAQVPPELKRALLFKAAEGARQPAEKVRLMRALLDEARPAGRLLPTAAALGSVAGDLRAGPEPPALAEAAIEVLLAAGRVDQARAWIGPGDRTGLAHWLALAELADAGGRLSASRLVPVEQLAQQGRLASDFLHRLATVLDALDVLVPIPLWEAASRTPQPDGGHLPQTGVLSQLQDASKKKEVARTILLTLRTVGPNGAEGAHMIALGDSIRALKRAGLEREARALGFEALFAAWPRLAASARAGSER